MNLTRAMSEPRNAEMEDAIRRQHFADEPLLVYADWLEERGSRRGEMIRRSKKEPQEQLISSEWANWFGDIPRSVLSLNWHCGVARGLAMNGPVHELASVLSLPILGLVDQLELDLTSGVDAEAFALPALMKAPWLSKLQYLGLRLSNDAAATRVIEAKVQLNHIAKLFVSLPASSALRKRDGLRAAFPQMRVAPVAESRPPDFVYACGGLRVNVEPVRAPANWRSLSSTLEKVESLSEGEVRASSGAAMPEYELNVCGACSSTDTRCIYFDVSRIFSDFETTCFKVCEYECMECHRFTSYESHRYS